MIKKNVIIIRNAYSFDFGGGERFPVFLACSLLKSGYNPVIISRSPKLLEFAGEQNIRYLRGWWWSRQNWNGRRALLFPIYILWQIILFFYYFDLFIKLNPNIIHIQSKDDFIAATFAGRVLKKRIIWTDHADLKHIFKNHHIWYKNPVGKFIYLASYFANQITVVSESEKKCVSDHFRQNNPIIKKLKVVYNGAFDTYKKVAKSKKFTFVTTNRLVTDKGVNELFEAYDIFSKTNRNTELHIIGDGPEKDKFINKAKPNKSIIFYGHQTDPFQFVNHSHIFILPTYHEGFSVALVEACMLNMPIIATDVGGNPEIIIDHKTGLLIPSKDAGALYNAMQLLFDNELLRNRLGDNARKQYLEKFQFDQIVENNFIPLYKGNK